jgi:hypothetical protein
MFVLFTWMFFIGTMHATDPRLESLRKVAKVISLMDSSKAAKNLYQQTLKLTSSEEEAFQTLHQQVWKAHPKLQTELLFITRNQYQLDHHNTATLFQKGEINDYKFDGGSALKSLNLSTGQVREIFTCKEGVVRDPELSYDGTRIIFSYRKQTDDDYHIYTIDTDGSNLQQLTFAKGVSDIDPLFLPDGDILFSSTREPKYCMCNRHIMANLYRMTADGANIVQLGKNTLFEGHSTLLHDGRIIYDRWEYVDRNFGDAQGLWTANPDGTNHAIFYGNNMNSPGGVIDPRVLPGSNLVACIFGSCHDRPWGALAIIDRTKGVDGPEAVVNIWPETAREKIGIGNWDKFMELPVRYEDPYPIDHHFILCSRTLQTGHPIQEKMGLFLVDRYGNEWLIHQEEQSCFDPMIISARLKEPVVPVRSQYNESPGYFYVQNVYEGTHMDGVHPGSVKYFRVVESPEKRTFTKENWQGQGAQAPGMNWHSFENKRILGEAAVENDGSVYVEVPANKFVYFQLLDKDKKMIQSMRSGTMVQSGEVRGCIGCHEDRLSVPPAQTNRPKAMMKPPVSLVESAHQAPHFSYVQTVQPILDKHCISCHDFGSQNKSGLILAGDKNPFFNASYVDLYTKQFIRPIGAGPSRIQEAYSWGTHASRLTHVIDSIHHDVLLSREERETIYSWLDLNGVYYPFYESAYPENPAGRSPLTHAELKRLGQLTNIDFNALNAHWRKLGPQIAFDRPELSPCLKSISGNKKKYNEALAIIQLGRERLIHSPRAEMPGFEPCDEHKEMLKKYMVQLEIERKFRNAIEKGEKQYDSNN